MQQIESRLLDDRLLGLELLNPDVMLLDQSLDIFLDRVCFQIRMQEYSELNV